MGDSEQFECPKCKWEISKMALDAMLNDWFCPRCRKVKYADFKKKVINGN